MSSAEFEVPGAHCGSCRADIERILRAVPGVASAIVDLRNKSLTVGFEAAADPASATAAVIGALRGAGYEVRERLAL